MSVADDTERLSVSTTRTVCGICLEDAMKPKLLPCLHSFCLHCLQQHIDSNTKSGRFKCPLCRRRLNKPSTGADGFEDNVYTDPSQHVDEGAEMKCQACDEREASQTCVECRQLYCEACAKLHLRMSTSKTHSVRAVDKEEARAKINTKICCETHQNKKLSYYCLDCREVICGKCIIEKHKTHSCDEVSEIAKTCRADLNALLSSPNNGYQFVAMLESNCSDIQKGKSSFQNDVYNECLKIEVHANRVKERIDKATKSLISEVTGKEKDIVSRYTVAIQEADGKVKWAKGTIQTVAQMLEVSSDTEIVVKHEGLKNELMDLKSQILPTQVVNNEVKFMRYTPSNEDMVRSVGYIDIKGPIQFESLSKIEFPSASLGPPIIKDICTLSESEACVVFERSVQITDKYGEKKPKIEFEEDVFAAAQDKNGDVYVAGQSAVYILKGMEVPSKVFKLCNIPNEIAFTKDGDLVICFEKAGMVSVFSKTGKSLLTLDSVRVKRPSGLAVHDDKIAVLDQYTDNIAVCNTTGNLLPPISTSGLCPISISFDTRGCLVLGDTKGCIHLLDSTKGYLQTLVSPRQKGHGPVCSLTFDPSGDLWVGDNTGIVSVLYECK